MNFKQFYTHKSIDSEKFFYLKNIIHVGLSSYWSKFLSRYFPDAVTVTDFFLTSKNFSIEWFYTHMSFDSEKFFYLKTIIHVGL